MMQNKNEEMPQSFPEARPVESEAMNYVTLVMLKKQGADAQMLLTSTEEPPFFLQKFPSRLSLGACTEAHRLSECIAAFLGEKGIGQCSW